MDAPSTGKAAATRPPISTGLPFEPDPESHPLIKMITLINPMIIVNRLAKTPMVHAVPFIDPTDILIFPTAP
jgi:hypothetical protein